MPQGEWKEQGNYPIPTDTLVPVRLTQVIVKPFQSKDKTTKEPLFNPDGSKDMYNLWEWTFQVTGGDYQGMKITNLTPPYVSPADGNEPRMWAETLLNLPQWEPGRGLNTDDLIGLEGMATVKHEAPRKRGDGKGMWYGIRLDDLFPASAMAEPPF